MNLIEALKHARYSLYIDNSRIQADIKMYWHPIIERWIIQKNGITILETTNEEEAVTKLIGEE